MVLSIFYRIVQFSLFLKHTSRLSFYTVSGMESLLIVVVITVLVVVLSSWVVKEKFSSPLAPVEGVDTDSDFRLKVRVRDGSDKQLSANILTRLAYRLGKVVKLYEQKDKHKAQFLVQNWNPTNIEESDPDSDTTSYSLNKGQKLVFCIRHKGDDTSFVDDNTLTFVGIHELAHLMTTEVGHTPLFWSNMKTLLDVAVEHNLYIPENYEAKPKKYCGIEITSSPLDDSSF